MNRHLSQAEISAAVTGESGSDAAVHLETCARCRQQVEHFENVLGHFRSSVRDWSDSHFNGRVAVQPRRRLWPAMAYSFAVALIVLISVVGYRFSTQRSTVAAPSGLESDTLLLKHVKADVSRSAPPGMETLLGFSSAESVQR
jgi:anti-sigma factor RsiW